MLYNQVMERCTNFPKVKHLVRDRVGFKTQDFQIPKLMLLRLRLPSLPSPSLNISLIDFFAV